ncbi:unnamed protein product [Paramecium octaurelia]|uniref:Uncharacterized protein n=1 Tax=Paramecium octaurelia TaxID=43137 RepID=A0A8S1Y575_PAROT|nr:unnamed protein product [Paramecium octaurelia]
MVRGTNQNIMIWVVFNRNQAYFKQNKIVIMRKKIKKFTQI